MLKICTLVDSQFLILFNLVSLFYFRFVCSLFLRFIRSFSLLFVLCQPVHTVFHFRSLAISIVDNIIRSPLLPP